MRAQLAAAGITLVDGDGEAHGVQDLWRAKNALEQRRVPARARRACAGALTAACAGCALTPPRATALCASWKLTCLAVTRRYAGRWRLCGRCGAAGPRRRLSKRVALATALTARSPARAAQPRGNLSDSLARALLCVPCLQTDVAEGLLHRLPVAAADAGSDLPASLLAQFRWLDHVSDAKALTDKVLDVLRCCPPPVQKGATPYRD